MPIRYLKVRSKTELGDHEILDIQGKDELISEAGTGSTTKFKKCRRILKFVEGT
jgi:hypothetical protein